MRLCNLTVHDYSTNERRGRRRPWVYHVREPGENPLDRVIFGVPFSIGEVKMLPWTNYFGTRTHQSDGADVYNANSMRLTAYTLYLMENITYKPTYS